MREPGLTSARTAGCCFSVEALGGRAGWSGDAVGPARTAKVPSRAASQRAAADRELLADRLAGHGRVAPGGHSESRCRGRRGRAPGWWRRGRRSRSPRRRSASGPPTGRRRAAAGRRPRRGHFGDRRGRVEPALRRDMHERDAFVERRGEGADVDLTSVVVGDDRDRDARGLGHLGARCSCCWRTRRIRSPGRRRNA